MRRPGVPHPADLPNRLGALENTELHAPPQPAGQSLEGGRSLQPPAPHGEERSGLAAHTHQISLFSSWKVAWPALLTRACICICRLSSRTMYVNLPSAELRMSRARFPDG